MAAGRRRANLPRTEGHARGEAALFDVIEGAIEIGVKYLSAYAFSTENWNRSPDEVRWLMGFNRDVIRRRRDQLDAMGVRVRWAGRSPRLWRSVISELEDAERRTVEQRRADPAVLRELRRPGRDRRRQRGESPSWRPRDGSIRASSPRSASGISSTNLTSPTSTSSSARRGAADLQLPALAERVRRAGVS